MKKVGDKKSIFEKMIAFYHFHFSFTAATRYHSDMTEKLLKVMLNPNKQQQQFY